MTYQKHKNLNSETKTDIKTHEPIQNELTWGLKNKTEQNYLSQINKN